VHTLREAIERSRVALRRDSELHVLKTPYASLTSRERQVTALVVLGLMNKQVGAQLGMSEITVQGHGGRAMRKMRVASLPGLVAVAAQLDPTAVVFQKRPDPIQVAPSGSISRLTLQHRVSEAWVSVKRRPCSEGVLREY
jgi:DNA-binding CsgD family transcriptional regulator